MGRHSLAGRMMIGLASCVALLWVALVTWAVVSALATGKEQTSRDLETYSRQVLSVAKFLASNPANLAKGMAAVESIEQEPDGPGEKADPFFIEAWLHEKLIYSEAPLTKSRPDTPGFHEKKVGKEYWWSYVQMDPPSGVAIRLSVSAGGVAAILWPDAITLFLPLIVSLPLLLIPAWFMTRFGLTPLGKTADQISDRVSSGDLTALPLTNYRELDPVVQATNRLMERLSSQLRRERELVADVAHEMKTPLAIAQTNLGILQTSQSPERRRDATSDLKAGINRSNRLIQQLLRMARLEQELDFVAQKRLIDLAEFIRERVAQAAVLAHEHRLQIELDAPETCPATIDVDAIAAVVDNLIDNAIKYSPPGGRVFVRLIQTGEPDELAVSVEDQGPGIPESDQNAAFDRFRRLANHNQATLNEASAGLGLSIVARATERLGGRIDLLPASGQSGLLARLTVPRAASTAKGKNANLA
ncbi:MAG: HAMP domain-containing sensor histidine kinase [Burkholderiaceae bacterium]